MEPAAPQPADISESACPRMNDHAKNMLPAALTSCSRTCDIAVGIMVLLAWKKPLRVPRSATTKIVMASTFNGIAIPVKLL